MSLFTDAIEQAQARALAWPVAVVSRETDETHLSPGRMETHLVCMHGPCDQSVFRLHPAALDASHMPIDQVYIMTLQTVLASIAAHIRQCHEDGRPPPGEWKPFSRGGWEYGSRGATP